MNTPSVKLWTKDFSLIILINFLVFINHIMVLSTFPFYIESLGGSEALSGLAAALFSLVSVFFRPFVGWILDSGKRRLIMIIGLCGMSLMPIGYMCVSVIYLALICRMMHGVALANASTAASTLATDIVPKQRLAEGMGMFGMATALATACAPALGLFLLNKVGYSAMFLCATSCAVVAFVLFLLLKIPKVDAVKSPLSFKRLFEKDALPASATMLVFLLTFGALENFIAIFAREEGLPSGGLFFTIMACILLLVRFTLGKVADRRGERLFVYTCNASMFAAFLLLAFVPNNITFFLAAILAGYGFGGIEPALQAMAVHSALPNRRGAANSTFLCSFDLGLGIGSGIAGLLITALGYNRMFALISIANIASVILYIFWGRNHPSSLSNVKNRVASEST